MKTKTALSISVILIATSAFAHQGVKDPAVKSWMSLMEEIAVATKVIGDMAKGERPFDAKTAQEAAADLAQHSANVSDAFETRADDPQSEALPAIWDNFADFTSKADAMEQEARIAATEIQSPEDLRPMLASIGKTCSDCHRAYRE